MCHMAFYTEFGGINLKMKKQKKSVLLFLVSAIPKRAALSISTGWLREGPLLFLLLLMERRDVVYIQGRLRNTFPHTLLIRMLLSPYPPTTSNTGLTFGKLLDARYKRLHPESFNQLCRKAYVLFSLLSNLESFCNTLNFVRNLFGLVGSCFERSLN